MTGLPQRADVEAAAARIAAHVRRTPLLHATIARRTVWLKLEHLQVTGSFKARGACNALLSLATPPPLVVAASGGNHGLGVAHAARVVGAAATIGVPESVPEEKARRLEDLGATVLRHGREYAEAEQHARAVAAELAAPFLHPFADAAVIAGQGTVGLEIAADLGDACDAVLVAVGGGGLLAGVATALHGTGTRVIGVEPTGIPTVSAALSAGHPVDVGMDSVTASALGARATDPLNLEVIASRADGVVLVDDADILAARDLLWDSCRLAVEPAAAAPLAALLTGAVDARAPCLVLCGANSAWAPA